ncbi:MAG TPA: hypothetical protein VF669_19255 [Tepidisphaeraceae bacterium]|jgi:hypothetical protein
MTDLIFDTPWWLPALLGIVGIVLFITGNNRQEFRIRTAGLAVLLLAIAVMAVSYFVDTNREKAENGSRALVRSVADREWGVMTKYLDPKASVSVLNAATVANNRDEIIALAKRGTEQYGLKTVRIIGLESRQDQSLITITATIITDQSSFMYNLPSTWQFEWIARKDGLGLYRITCLKIGNQSGPTAESRFPKP